MTKLNKFLSLVSPDDGTYEWAKQRQATKTERRQAQKQKLIELKNKHMKYYVTKYALTEGIQEVEGDADETILRYKTINGFTNYITNENFHENLESAKVKAENMRLKKIISLEKQLQKLKKLSFKN